MQLLSSTEENYLKAIYKLSNDNQDSVSTNAIADLLETAAASVTDMLKRLTEKELVLYEKYKGVKLSASGRKCALLLIRKHRLWETFMVQKLDFTWDEVHVVAEQLEHIRSEKLIDSLDAFLDFPKVDPHGDPIPDKNGFFELNQHLLLAELKVGDKGTIVGVSDDSKTFLKYLEQLNLTLGMPIEVLEVFEYDRSYKLRQVQQDKVLVVTNKVAQNLLIKQK